MIEFKKYIFRSEDINYIYFNTKAETLQIKLKESLLHISTSPKEYQEFVKILQRVIHVSK